MSELTPDEIRQRRLARLGNQTPRTSAPTQEVTETTSTPPSQPAKQNLHALRHGASSMEVDHSQDSYMDTQSDKGQSQLDVDSGIETMEVDDPEPKRKRISSPGIVESCYNISSGSEATEDQVKKALCRVFAVSWSEDLSKSDKILYLQELAHLAATSLTQPLDLQDLINQMVMEAVFVIQDSPPALTATEQQSSDAPASGFWKDKTYHSRREFSANVTVRPSTDLTLLSYLIDCYERISVEEKHAPKRSSVPPLSNALTAARKQCVCFTSLTLQGAFTQSRSQYVYSALIPFLLSHNLPGDFLHELVHTVYASGNAFSKVFSPILQYLSRFVAANGLSSDKYRAPLAVMSDLCSIKASNCRPICDLMVQQSNWLPDPITQAEGTEIEKLSLLGPFLALSVFAEDDGKVVEHFFPNHHMSSDNAWAIYKSLMCNLEEVRTHCFHIMHNLLVNPSTREATLDFIARTMERNSKRSQIQFDERFLCGDGFMLNLMSVLQKLSQKIVLDKKRSNEFDQIYVFPEMYYDFFFSGLPSYNNQSEGPLLKCNIHSFMDSLAITTKGPEPKFSTECFFLTLHCQHLSILPVTRKYQRRLRAIRDLHRLISDMEAAEPQWRELPTAGRSREQLKKWKSQYQRLQKSKMCADAGVLDKDMIARCLSFYTRTSDLLMRIADPANRCTQVPLPDTVPGYFSALPEFYLEDMADFILFAL
ncbi:hypothetical protein EGW08_016227, partial [Elysia chlorotica]